MPIKEERLTDRIIQDPAILVGKPVVRGTRIPVELVLAYLANNPSFEELFTDYPRLTMEDIRACFAYAHGKVGKTRRVTQTSPARQRSGCSSCWTKTANMRQHMSL